MKTAPTRSRINNSARSLNWPRTGKRIMLAPPLAGPAVEGNGGSGRTGHSHIRPELSRAVLAYQRMDQVGSGLGVTQQRSDLPSFASQDGHAISVEHAIAGQGRNPVSRRNHARQVQGIGSADADQLASTLQPSDRTELTNGLGEGELFPGHPGNEPPAANLASSLEPAIDHQQLPPEGCTRFPRQEPLVDYSVPPQQGSCGQLHPILRSLGAAGAQQRPSPGSLDPMGSGPVPPPGPAQRLAFARRRNQGAQ